MMRKAMLALVLLTLGACGDDAIDEGQVSLPEATTTTTTAETSTTIAGTTVPTTSGRSTTTTAPAVTLECRTVGFTPNSEDAASSIRATGLSCAEAEAFVRKAGQQTSSGGPQRVQVDGYRCVLVRSVQEPLPQAFYECTDGSKRVTFVRT